MHSFIHDAKRFALYNRSVIEQVPLQLYCSTLVFAPENSIIRKKFKSYIPDWIQLKPKVQAHWNTALHTLEGHTGLVASVAFSPDGKQVVSGSSSSSSSSSLFNVWWATRSVAATTPPEGYKDVERLYYSLIIYTRPRYYPFHPLLIVFLQISIQLIAEACLPEGVSTCNPTSAGWVGIQHICSEFIQCLFLL